MKIIDHFGEYTVLHQLWLKYCSKVEVAQSKGLKFCLTGSGLGSYGD